MNERIRQLSAQAWKYADNNSHGGDGTHGWLYSDKFAELNVQECTSLASEPDSDMNDTERGILAQIKTSSQLENECTTKTNNVRTLSSSVNIVWVSRRDGGKIIPEHVIASMIASWEGPVEEKGFKGIWNTQFCMINKV